MQARVLTWEGSQNGRDLGGLRTQDGRTTRWGAVVRSDTPARLTAAGWDALHDYGIRTIITLRTYGMTEDELDFTAPYKDIAVVQAAIEDITDEEFVRLSVETSLWGTPLYYRDALQRWPERHAAAIGAIGQAQPGGVLFHCIRGHDRTGIIALLLLALVGVVPDDLVADYELSVDPIREKLMQRAQTSVRETLLSTLDGMDVEDYLRRGGASQKDLEAVRQRLVGQES